MFRSKVARIISFLIAFWLVVGCSSSLSPTPTTTPAPAATLTTEITNSIVYANVDDTLTRLDVITPSQQGPWPMVVLVHGFNQNRFEFEHLARAIASHGAVVYNTDVEFSVPFLPSIERLACAVRFARASATDYDGDPDSITLVGHSAGAASGLVVGLAGDDFKGDCIESDVSAIPDAFVGYEGPYDFITVNYGGVVNHTYLKQTDPVLAEALNPYSHIGRNPDLQIHLIHGDDVDSLWYEVKPEVSNDMHQALVDAGYDAELTVLEGATHRDLSSQYSEVFAVTIQEVMEFVHGP